VIDDSLSETGILSGDFVVVQSQQPARKVLYFTEVLNNFV
jgi:hypothetical protein